MRLHTMKNVHGARRRRKRLGCGESSGHGKTSTRGGKGQTARTGSSLRIPFEGGQTPFIRRVPKRGFNNVRFKVRYAVVNVEALNLFDNNASVTPETLQQNGLVRGRNDGIKILGDGKLEKKLNVEAHAFSASARERIEKAGGQVRVIEPRKPLEKGVKTSRSKSAPKAKA